MARSRCEDYFVLGFFLFLTIRLASTMDSMNCETPIPTYGLVNLIILCLLQFFSFSSDYPTFFQCFRPFMILFYVLLFPFMLVWTILGTFWILSNLKQNNNCLTSEQIIFIFIGQGLIYLIYFSIFAFLIYLVCQLKKNANKQKVGKKQLLLFYENKNIAENLNIAEFLKQNSVLENKGILKKEEQLMEKYCSRLVNQNEDLVCVICLDQLKENEKCIEPGCTHSFHKQCIYDWFKVKPRCPMCKKYFRPYLMERYKEDQIGAKESNLNKA